MKKCPYCAEDIQDAAIRCRYCGSDLAPEAVALVSQGLAAEAAKPTAPEPAIEAVQSEPQPPLPTVETKPKRPIWKIALIVSVVFTILQVVAALAAYNNGEIGYDHLMGRLGLTIPFLSVIAAGIVVVIIAIWRAIASPPKATPQAPPKPRPQTQVADLPGEPGVWILVVIAATFGLVILLSSLGVFGP